MKKLLFLLMFLPVLAVGQVHPTYQSLFSGGDFIVQKNRIIWTKCPVFNPIYLTKTQPENFSFEFEYLISEGKGIKKLSGKGEIWGIEPIDFACVGDFVIITVRVKPKGKWYGAGDGQEYWLQKKFYFVGNKKHGLFNLGQ